MKRLLILALLISGCSTTEPELEPEVAPKIEQGVPFFPDNEDFIERLCADNNRGFYYCVGR